MPPPPPLGEEAADTGAAPELPPAPEAGAELPPLPEPSLPSVPKLVGKKHLHLWNQLCPRPHLWEKRLQTLVRPLNYHLHRKPVQNCHRCPSPVCHRFLKLVGKKHLDLWNQLASAPTFGRRGCGHWCSPELPPAPEAGAELPLLPEPSLPPVPEAGGEEAPASLEPTLPTPPPLGGEPAENDTTPELPAIPTPEELSSALPAATPVSTNTDSLVAESDSAEGANQVEASESADNGTPPPVSLPTLEDVAGDIQSDPIAPAQDQNNSVEDAVEVDEQESDEDEDDEEDDNASDEDQDTDEEEEELCEISKLKVNVMVIKNKLKSLEEAIGSKSSSEGEDSSSVSDELSRYKEETREELDSLFKRVDELDEMPEALKSEDAKIEELKLQLDSAEAKREENKKMILALIDEIKETKEKGDANEQTNQDLGLGKIEDKIASIESKITDLQNSQSGERSFR